MYMVDISYILYLSYCVINCSRSHHSFWYNFGTPRTENRAIRKERLG